MTCVFHAQERLLQTTRNHDGRRKRTVHVAGQAHGGCHRPPLCRLHVGQETKNYRRKQYVADGERHPSISIAAKPLEEFVWTHIEKPSTSRRNSCGFIVKMLGLVRRRKS